MHKRIPMLEGPPSLRISIRKSLLALLWIIVGVANFVMMYWSYKKDPAKMIFW